MIRSMRLFGALKSHWADLKMNHCERLALSIIDTGQSARHIRRQTCHTNVCLHDIRVSTNSHFVHVYSALNASGFWRCVPVNNFISTNTGRMLPDWQWLSALPSFVYSVAFVIAAAKSKILFFRCWKFEVNPSKSIVIHNCERPLAALLQKHVYFFQPHIFIQAGGCVKWTKQLKCTKNSVCFWCAKQKRIWLSAFDVIRTWRRAFGRLLLIAGILFLQSLSATTLSQVYSQPTPKCFCFSEYIREIRRFWGIYIWARKYDKNAEENATWVAGILSNWMSKMWM